MNVDAEKVINNLLTKLANKEYRIALLETQIAEMSAQSQSQKEGAK
ncbi:hypothetical protein [Halalkalibacter sp. APA_J-10(15)]|nr:hypothetical protein [Halalkalibacter sp. APA_J-10(15)]MCK0471388.1 hypothetical protein [Halalkalibacter sp. APA_J-10(15)]